VVQLVLEALSGAGLSAGDVDVVFAAANGTSLLDRTEAAAVEQVFGPRAVPVVALKGAIGEFGAEGAAALTAALACLARGGLPPTVGCAEPDEACRVDVRDQAQRARGRVALVNAAAAGGSHYSLVVRAAASAF
jgi:act minimal PKS chain-length factor (CLF/KS beta)